MPSMAPTRVISRPLDHQERMVISDLAAPTAKCAASEMIAATMIAGKPAMKKNGRTGMKAPTAVESAPEVDLDEGVAEDALGGQAGFRILANAFLVLLIDTHCYFDGGRLAFRDNTNTGDIADRDAFEGDGSADLEAGGIFKIGAQDNVSGPEAAGGVGHKEDERDEGAKSDDHQNAHFQL